MKRPIFRIRFKLYLVQNPFLCSTLLRPTWNRVKLNSMIAVGRSSFTRGVRLDVAMRSTWFPGRAVRPPPLRHSRTSSHGSRPWYILELRITAMDLRVESQNLNAHGNRPMTANGSVSWRLANTDRGVTRVPAHKHWVGELILRWCPIRQAISYEHKNSQLILVLKSVTTAVSGLIEKHKTTQF